MKTKIAILGLGGVGGYFGGKLAKQYQSDNEVEIYFLARGEHLSAIKDRGLHVSSDAGEDFIANPTLVTDDANQIGVCDYVIVATKSYDLASSINPIKPCIGDKTAIIPLLNGGNIAEKIKTLLPDANVWQGLTYIVGRKTASGAVHSYGDFRKLVFGSESENEARLLSFEKLLKDAGIEVELSKDIRLSVWKKFFFISVSASLTSYFNSTFNDLVNNLEQKAFLDEFAREFMAVADSEGIHLEQSDFDYIVKRCELLPAGSTSSMHSDFKAGYATEIDNLTGEVIQMAYKNQVFVPLYEKVYTALVEKR